MRPLRLLALIALIAASVVPVAAAQNPPIVPDRPAVYFMDALEREAGVQLTGTVTQTINFPPSNNPNRQLKELPPPPITELQLLRRNFRLMIEPGEPIAGRETWRLTLQPRNPSAPTFHYWIDREWRVRLGFDELDSTGAVTDRARFTAFDGVPTSLPKARRLNRFKFDPSLEATLLTALPGLSLPDGFRLMMVRPRQVQGQSGLELRASNGLSVLVLVLSPVGNKGGPKLAVRNVSGTWLWVVANLPKSDLNKVAQSVVSIDLVALGNLIADRPR